MYWLVLHAGFMSTAVGFMLAGIKIAMSYRRRRWWLKAHRRVGFTGAAVMAAGFMFAVFMVLSYGGEHFDSPHTWIGVSTFLCALLTITLGLSLFRFPARAALIRKFHRWMGRFTAMIAAINVLFGFVLAIL